MSGTKLTAAVLIALTVACVTADASGRLLRGFRRSCNYTCQSQGIGESSPGIGTNKRDSSLPSMKTLYYCVNNVWMARACGEDVEALADLARAEGLTQHMGNVDYNPRTLSISLFATKEAAGTNSRWVIEDFGSLDGQPCG